MGTQRVIAASAVLGLALAASPPPASANRSEAAGGARSNADDVKKDLVVLGAPGGRYIALAPDLESRHVYYGDRQRLHRQRVLLTASDEDDNLSVVLWSPGSPSDAAVELEGERWFLRCGSRRTPLEPVAGGERAKLLATAKLLSPRLRRAPYALGRNERGEYFYVDRENGARGSQGFRLYRGRVGAVRRLRLRWVVSDSEGDVFATRGGQLRIAGAGAAEPTLEWRRGKRRELLLPVPAAQNSYLIYKELGVYQNQQLDTPCDGH